MSDVEQFEITSYKVKRGSDVLPSWVPVIQCPQPVLLSQQQLAEIIQLKAAGLTEQQFGMISKLPADEQCAICCCTLADTTEMTDAIRTLVCGHCFHAKCVGIPTQLLRHRRCGTRNPRHNLIFR